MWQWRWITDFIIDCDQCHVRSTPNMTEDQGRSFGGGDGKADL